MTRSQGAPPHRNRRIELVTENARVAETAISQGDSLTCMPIAGPPTQARPLCQQYQEAFDHVLPAASALSEEALVPVNVDVPSALSTAVSALPNILALRDAALRLPDFDIAHFDHLQQYTFALGHAHAMFLAASESLRATAALRERGIKVRDA